MTSKPYYGLFEKVDEKWVRLYPTMKYNPQRLAAKMFQNSLLAGAMGMVSNERRIRRIKEES
jgi:hypothetical protein